MLQRRLLRELPVYVRGYMVIWLSMHLCYCSVPQPLQLKAGALGGQGLRRGRRVLSHTAGDSRRRTKIRKQSKQRYHLCQSLKDTVTEWLR